MLKEMDRSLGEIRFIFMQTLVKRDKCQCLPLDNCVQFSMTIFYISPTVYTIDHANSNDSHLSFTHSMLADQYLLLFKLVLHHI